VTEQRRRRRRRSNGAAVASSIEINQKSTKINFNCIKSIKIQLKSILNASNQLIWNFNSFKLIQFGSKELNVPSWYAN